MVLPNLNVLKVRLEIPDHFQNWPVTTDYKDGFAIGTGMISFLASVGITDTYLKWRRQTLFYFFYFENSVS